MLIAISLIAVVVVVTMYLTWSLLKDTVLVFLSPVIRWIRGFLGLCATCGGFGGILTACALSPSWWLTLGVTVGCLPLIGIGIAWSPRSSRNVQHLSIPEKLDNLHVTRY